MTASPLLVHHNFERHAQNPTDPSKITLRNASVLFDFGSLQPPSLVETAENCEKKGRSCEAEKKRE